ncbi:MAG: nitroreductase [Rhodoblastus sp.]|nr:MAG: nitroreductase [Rhodoblastus sp.]
MNDVLRLLTRRSTPPAALAAPGPTAQELTTLLTIAARVPDHGKLAPWRFIVFEGEGRERAGRILVEVAHAQRPDASLEQIEAERRRMTSAPLVVAVVSTAAPHPKIPQVEQLLSAAACCQNLLIGAEAMGYGAAWVTNWFAYDRAALSRLGVADDETVVGFVHIGSRAERLEDRPRPALETIVTRF